MKGGFSSAELPSERCFMTCQLNGGFSPAELPNERRFMTCQLNGGFSPAELPNERRFLADPPDAKVVKIAFKKPRLLRRLDHVNTNISNQKACAPISDTSA
jgi:hypothetical protein